MNFIDDFKYIVGETETPPDFIEWCAYSLLAAACGSHVYLPYRIGFREVHVMPNLYVLLIGPSGVGKSFIIGTVKDILKKIEAIEAARRVETGQDCKRMNVYPGYTTHSGMYDMLKNQRRTRDPKTGEMTTIRIPWAGQLYLLQDELAADVGDREHADLFMKALTNMYHGEEWNDQTRTNGRVHLEDFCINWLAGSTMDWLVDAISQTTLMSGAFGRIVSVYCNYPGKRIPPNTLNLPPDWDERFSTVVGYIDELLSSEGAMQLTKEAREVDVNWYMTRERPAVDDHALQVLQRQHQLSLKLAILNALAEGTTTIDGDHLAKAQDKTDTVLAWQREVLPQIRRGASGTPPEKVLQFILGSDGWVAHKKVYKFAYDKFNIPASRMDDLIRTWEQAGIIIERRNRAVTQYANSERRSRNEAEAND